MVRARWEHVDDAKGRGRRRYAFSRHEPLGLGRRSYCHPDVGLTIAFELRLARVTAGLALEDAELLYRASPMSAVPV